MLVQLMIDADAFMSAQHPDTVLGFAMVSPMVLGGLLFFGLRRLVAA